MITKTLLLWGLIGAAPLYARAPSDGPIKRLYTEVDTLETSYTELFISYTNKRGLLSQFEAQDKYERAVMHYLTGEYEAAALILFTVIESDALYDEVLRTDAEWYLAHSTFLMGNYSISSDILYLIIESGETHPFYEDAVRTLLELYGLTKNTRMFDRTYERFIVSGIVTTTDAINYSIGKSLFWQGENARSKSILNTLPVTSAYYHRARYFLGGVLASENDFENAVIEFDKSLTVSMDTKEGLELRDLSILALGRVNLEAGNYQDAINIYQQLPNRSPYKSEQLYELTWCYILKGDYLEALRVIEVFLIAYPDDEKALKLKIVQGNLYVNINEYEQSLVAYERVIRQLTPIQNHLRDIQTSESSTESFFQALVDENEEILSTLDLPNYAYDVLESDNEIGRAVQINRDSQIQRSDIDLTQSMFAEVSAVLNSEGSIGMFQQGFNDMESMRERCLVVLLKTIDTQMEYLKDNVSASEQIRFEALRLHLEQLKGGVVDMTSLANQKEDILGYHRDQIREVQGQAKQVQETADTILAKAEELSSQMEFQDLTDEEQLYINELLNSLRNDASSASTKLRELQTEEVLLNIMSTVKLDDTRRDEPLSEDMFIAISQIHADLKPYWSTTKLDEEVKDTYHDKIYSAFDRTVNVYLSIGDSMDSLRITERRERMMLSAILKEQVGAVKALETKMAEVESLTNDVGLRVATSGFGRLEKNISENILNADSGIVRIYWQRKSDVEDEITRLNRELNERKGELETKFKFIESKFSEE